MKKTFSIVLAIVLICTGILPSIAATEKCLCGEAPIIYVAALGSGYVFLDQGTPNEVQLFRPETDKILNDFTPLVSAAADLIKTKNYDAFGDTLISCVNESFGMLALDDNGNSHPRVTSEEFHPDTEEHGVHTNYYYGYDFRLDPVENARGLYQYVQEVKELTKHDTVRFRASSMGGVVTLSYMKLYGTEDIETIIFQCCPLQGTAVAGELYNGKVHIDKDALINYAEGALPDLGSDIGGGILYTLIEMLEAGGVWRDLVGLADKLVLNLKDRVFNEALIPIFATMPGIWSFVPDEYYESAKVFMKLDPDTQSGVIKKIDFYHYEVQSKAEELLKGAQACGTTVYIVAGYNMQRTPLVEAYRNTSDGTVDTQYASAGATCALLGEYLPKNYKQAAHPEAYYISPDRIIDASTCILPESTWFIKDMLHSTTHDGHDLLYRTMFTHEGQMTVHDYAQYPQFMQNDTVHQSFYPVTREGTSVEEAIKDATKQPSFFNVTKMFIEFFKAFWSFMMG